MQQKYQHRYQSEGCGNLLLLWYPLPDSIARSKRRTKLGASLPEEERKHCASLKHQTWTKVKKKKKKGSVNLSHALTLVHIRFDDAGLS
jgi:hypothetical protein